MASCGPSPEDIANTQVAVSQLQTSAVSTVYAQMTANGPTATLLPTSTPRPMSTPKPTPTPGAFSNPAPIGSSIALWDGPVKFNKFNVTLLDVQRGEAGKQVAQQNMEWYSYQEPIEGQEYLAVLVRIDYLETDTPNEVQSTNPYFHLTLRYSFDGDDIWASDMSKLVEGYVPYSFESWVYFLIRKDTQPMLYFQPYLMVAEQYDFRTDGGFFNLTKP